MLTACFSLTNCSFHHAITHFYLELTVLSVAFYVALNTLYVTLTALYVALTALYVTLTAPSSRLLTFLFLLITRFPSYRFIHSCTHHTLFPYANYTSISHARQPFDSRLSIPAI